MGNSEVKVWRPGVLGLNNLQNTCYLNAAFHCLAHTPLLANELMAWRTRTGAEGAESSRVLRAVTALLWRVWRTGPQAGSDKSVCTWADSGELKAALDEWISKPDHAGPRCARARRSFRSFGHSPWQRGFQSASLSRNS